MMERLVCGVPAFAELAREDLRRSGLSGEMVREAGIRIFSGGRDELVKKLGRSKIEGEHILKTCCLLEFPYFGRDGSEMFSVFKPVPQVGEAKYLHPAGVPARPYILPRVAAAAEKASYPLWITEGEKKALKLVQHGCDAVALAGVWGFKAGKKSASESDKALWSDLLGFEWSGRTAFLAFDQDLWTNPQVRYALYELGLKLYSLGADVRFPVWDEGKGIDDFLVSAPDACLALEGLKREARDILSFLRPAHSAEILRAAAVARLTPVRQHQVETAIAGALKVPVSLVKKDVEARRNGGKSRLILDGLSERYVLIGGTTEIWDRREMTAMKADAFRLLYPVEGSAWLKTPSKPVVKKSDIVFSPQDFGKPDDGRINLFTGFSTVPENRPIPLFLDHLDAICGGDRAVRHWLTCWLAYPLQHPGAKMHSCVVVHGRQGTGKNILFEAIGRIYGEYFRQIGQLQIESRFTGWMSRKLFILADEVISNSNLSHVKNRLKAMITSDVVEIEEKNLNSRQEDNHANFVFLSNSTVPVLIDGDDRRHLIIRCDDVREDGHYAALAAERDNGGLAGIHAYLLGYDTADFAPSSKPPLTDAKKDLAELCEISAVRFGRQWAAGTLPVPFGACRASSLYQAFRTWCEENGEFKVTETRFARELKSLIERGELRLGRRRLSNGMTYETEDSFLTCEFEDRLKEWMDEVRKSRF